MKFKVADVELELPIENVIVAGWTGRIKAAVDHHINELAELGIKPPSEVPLYYRVSYALLTQSAHIDVLGEATSGEVEPFIFQADNKLWIGLASDHTDRDLEVYSVAASKQACAKPVANQLWEFETVKDHLDSLELSCKIFENEQWVQYQHGSLENIRPLSELAACTAFNNNTAMLCGTLVAIEGVRPARQYQMQLHDPILNNTIQLEYSVKTLPIVS